MIPYSKRVIDLKTKHFFCLFCEKDFFAKRVNQEYCSTFCNYQYIKLKKLNLSLSKEKRYIISLLAQKDFIKNKGDKKTKKEYIKEYMRGYYPKHKEKFSIRALAQRKIKEKPSYCQRCNEQTTKLQRHHPDYNKPLYVRWLCIKCHKFEDKKRITLIVDEINVKG